jgi:DNA anti-recombination protein RmuC
MKQMFKTKSSSSDLVEFAIKLPGRDDSGNNVWLPIDAKFQKISMNSYKSLMMKATKVNTNCSKKS